MMRMEIANLNDLVKAHFCRKMLAIIDFALSILHYRFFWAYKILAKNIAHIKNNQERWLKLQAISKAGEVMFLIIQGFKL